MDNRNNSRFSPPAVGGVSLLVAFAVLCLTVFALLALATVQADARLAGASAQAVADYYAADCQAQETLARLRAGERPKNNAPRVWRFWTGRMTGYMPSAMPSPSRTPRSSGWK